jgi:hypothetical protein
MGYDFLSRILLPEGIKSFCRTNRSIWRGFLGGKDRGDGSILVDGTQDRPAALIRMGITSNALKKVKGLKAVWVVKKASRKARRVINSYEADGIKTIGISLSPLTLLRSLLEAASVFFSLKEAGDTLKITCRGVLIGDLIYDSYIRETGSATVSRKDYYLYKKITEALFLYRWYERVIRKNKVKYAIVMHAVYNLMGVLLRVGIKHNVVVYGCVGMADQLSVRKYGSFDDVGHFQRSIHPELFDDVFKNRLALAKRQADGYFAERTGGDTSDPDVRNAYGDSKRVYSRPELARMLGLDPDKPFVFVMASAITDASHCFRWFLFKDNYDWALNTLRHIEGITDVNWILKEHPANKLEFYYSKHSLDRLAKDLYGESMPGHIAFLPDDVSTKTVLDCAGGVVTGFGTIGLEASCFGIKCLLAGESAYSGLGFTFDPETKEEYYGHLRTLFLRGNAATVDTDRAKAAAFIYFNHATVPFGMVPMTRALLLRLGKEEESENYGEAERLLKEMPLSEDYGVNRLLDYFTHGQVQLTNSFDIYDAGQDKQDN